MCDILKKLLFFKYLMVITVILINRPFFSEDSIIST